MNRYTRYEQADPTDDADGPPWVACDESGQDGENLTSTGKILAHGSVRIDDRHAAEVVAEIRSRLRPSQQRELKFSMCLNTAGVDALAWALGDDGPLYGRAHVYLAHKPFIASAKMIDLLIEELAHAHGDDIYTDGTAVEMARTMFREGRRGLGADRFAALIESFVSLFRIRQPKGGRDKETVDGFFQLIEDYRWSCRRASVEKILHRIAAAREYAEDFQQRLAAASDDLPMLDPLIPALAQTARYWAGPGGLQGVRLLHDQQNLLRDDRIDLTLAELRAPFAEFRRFARPVSVGALVRGNSHDHASMQLADIVAGAGRAAAEAALEIRTHPVEVGLIDTIGPIIDVHSLWGDDWSWQRLTGRSATSPR